METDSRLTELAQLIWDYHHLHHRLEKVDLILALGSKDAMRSMNRMPVGPSQGACSIALIRQQRGRRELQHGLDHAH
ncbi:MAG: hypothetical protein ACK5RS_14795, partial [Acidobacteriota bacterium]